jgi:hypothetical protein
MLDMRPLAIETTQVAASRTSKQNRKLGLEADLLPTARLTIGKICRISDSLKRALWKGVCECSFMTGVTELAPVTERWTSRDVRQFFHMLLSYRQRYIV